MNEAPLIRGDKVLLRQPIETDVVDFLNVEVSIELVRMYGGDTKNIYTNSILPYVSTS